jgi:hypothetical protein
MPRLDPEEAARRKRERSKRQWARMQSGEAYRQYNPGDGIGYGSEEQWRAAAGGGFTIGDEDAPPLKVDVDLRTLGLTAMPANASILKSAFRKQSFIVHPDYGGTDAAFIALRKAYVRVYDKLEENNG